MNHAAAAVSEQRQWDRLMAMAKLGAIPGDGVNRACLTELDRQARRLLIAWAKDIGATRLGGCRSQSVAAPRRQRSAGPARRHRQPHGHATERRPVRWHLRCDRRPGGDHRAARRQASHRAARSRWSPGPTRKAAVSPQAAWAACRGAVSAASRISPRLSTPTACALAMRWQRTCRRKPMCRRARSAASRTPMSRRISSKARGWRLKASTSAWSPASRAAAGSP